MVIRSCSRMKSNDLCMYLYSEAAKRAAKVGRGAQEKKIQVCSGIYVWKEFVYIPECSEASKEMHIDLKNCIITPALKGYFVSARDNLLGGHTWKTRLGTEYHKENLSRWLLRVAHNLLTDSLSTVLLLSMMYLFRAYIIIAMYFPPQNCGKLLSVFNSHGQKRGTWRLHAALWPQTV